MKLTIFGLLSFLQPAGVMACVACFAGSTSHPAGERLAVPAWDSLPGAADTIHLNFAGTSEPFVRNGRAVDPLGPYGGTLAQARDVWDAVAEKFSPFAVNVTTAPYAGDRDAAWNRAAEVIVSPTNFYGAYGIATVGVYGIRSAGYPAVAFVSGGADGSWPGRDVGEVAAHELGHVFGLGHLSRWNPDGSFADVYRGQDSTGTAPVMGWPLGSRRSVWSTGPTSAGPQTWQDDLSTLSRHLQPVPDDHGDTPRTATPLAVNVPTPGLIGIGDAGDVFSFWHCGGELDVSLAWPSVAPTLDGRLGVTDAAGVAVSVGSPADAGRYYAAVTPTGYGDLGTYTIMATPEPAAGLLVAVGLAWRRPVRRIR